MEVFYTTFVEVNFQFCWAKKLIENQNKQDKIDEIMKLCTTVKLTTNQLKDSDEGFDQLTAECSR